ncbi:MAG: methyltransferase domain-containing protein [Bacteroidales bacterium]
MGIAEPFTCRDRISNSSFILMKWFCSFFDLFRNQARLVERFGIQEGWTVIDYGCGPGRYVRRLSQLVGEGGLVYAVDIHELAMDCLVRLKRRYRLKNVRPVKAEGYFAPIPEDSADLILVIDVFRRVRDRRLFLEELHRLVRHHGRVVLHDGRRFRSQSQAQVEESGRWNLLEIGGDYLVIGPAWKWMPEAVPGQQK